MYQRLQFQLIFLKADEIVRTSPLPEWEDENADEDAWV